MSTLLIVEGSPPEIMAAGHFEADAFLATIKILAPGTACRPVAPEDVVPGEIFTGVDGVIFTGSGGPWPADAPEVAPWRDAMKVAMDTGLPIWGSCNGMQLAALVLGGAVGPSPNGIEIGVTRGMKITEAGQTHPLMAGRSDGYAVACMHRDEVQRLPEGAILIASNAHCPIQAFVYEKDGVDFWGAQYHPELEPKGVAGHIRRASIYSGFADLAADLEQGDTAAAAAARLGTTPQAFAPQNRARELVNWLAHVAARKAERVTVA